MTKFFYFVSILCWASITFAGDDEIKVNLNHSNFGSSASSLLTLPSSLDSNQNSPLQSNLLHTSDYFGFKSTLQSPLGLKLNFPNSSLWQPDYSSVCYNPFALQFSPSFMNTLNSFNDLQSNLQCTSINSGSLITIRFSKEYCQAYDSCVRGLDQSYIFLMNGIIAKEYANLMLNKHIHHMESREKMNAFALTNYDKNDLQLSCPLPISFDPKDQDSQKRCDPSIIDDVFLGMQKKCDSKQSSICFKDVKVEGKDFESFHKNSKTKKPQTSALVDFFTAKIESDTKSILATANNSLNELAAIINENIDEKKKMEKIQKALFQLSKENKLDPILNFENIYFDEISFKDTKIYKKISSLIANQGRRSGPPDSSQLATEIKKIRLELVNEYNKDACKESKNFNEICQNAKSINESKYVDGVFTMNNERFFPKENDEYVRNLPFDPKNGSAKKNFFILLESQRCNAFNYTGTKTLFGIGGGNSGSKITPSDMAFTSKAETKNNLSAESGSGSYDKYSSILKDVEPNHYNDGDSWSKSLEKKLQANGEEQFKGERVDVLANSKADPSASDNNNAVAPSTSSASMTGIPTTNNSFPTMNSPSTPSSANTNFANETEAVSEGKTSPASLSPDLSGKVDSLAKKLSDSEARIDKINKENEERARNQQFQNQQQEYDNEINSLNSKLGDLQRENTNLQAQNKKLSADQKQNSQELEEDDDANNSNAGAKPVISNSRGSDEGQTRKKDDSSNEGSEQGNSAVASNSSSTGGGSSFSSGGGESGASTSGKASGGSSASGTSGGAGRSGIVLTRIDNMTEDKAEETIFALIETNNGKPFTVEEGGFVKEIIPLVVDGKVQIDTKTGKPVYQKITKGKVADLKNISSTKVSSSTLPINSNADLVKAEQERLKRERVEYLKLKKQALEALAPASR